MLPALRRRVPDQQGRYGYVRYFSADLHCSCGYRAEIRNGIVYAECEEKYPIGEPDIDRELYRSAPSDLVSLI